MTYALTFRTRHLLLPDPSPSISKPPHSFSFFFASLIFTEMFRFVSLLLFLESSSSSHLPRSPLPLPSLSPPNFLPTLISSSPFFSFFSSSSFFSCSFSSSSTPSSPLSHHLSPIHTTYLFPLSFPTSSREILSLSPQSAPILLNQIIIFLLLFLFPENHALPPTDPPSAPPSSPILLSAPPH